MTAIAVGALVAATPPVLAATPPVLAAPAAPVVPVAPAQPGSKVTEGEQAGLQWLTLVTGDRVALGQADGEVRHFLPGAGRRGIGFVRRVEHGDTHVYPADAVSLVGAGLVDRRLFDVSLLARAGYGDAGRPDLPLIVTHTPGASANVAGAAWVGRTLASVDGAAVDVPKAEATKFWDAVTGPAAHTLTAGLTKVWLDGPVTPDLDVSVPQIGAPLAWQAGFAGAGTTVAVLDTGIDATHPDLAGAVVDAQDFTGGESGTADLIGHGTHVAGIITGNGAASGGTYRGVAPDATLLNGKVLADAGFGLESWIIAGMEWAAAQDADVVNLSLGGLDTPGVDPVEQAVNELTAQTGTLFVVAAGNSGLRGLSTPGTADAALTVGAVDRNDDLADFSGRGPRPDDLAIKPDITAAGVDIVSARAADTVIGEPVGDHYVRLSGTSMATPHVAGAAAILASQHPGWTAEELKPALMGSAAPRDGLGVFEQGAGRLDVARAVAQQVHATPASISNGIARWPHDDDEPIRTTLTYHNARPEPVTLDVAVQGRGPDGNPVPAGLFTIDRPSVTVPAGGTAAVQLTTNTAAAAPDGAYEGAVVATGGPVTVRTPIAITLEAESYDVRATVLDRDGRPNPNYGFALFGIERPVFHFAYDPSGTVVVRVPRGTYLLDSTVFMGTPESPGPVTSMIEPTFVVDRDLSLVMDAREGRPVGVALDVPDAHASTAQVTLERATSSGPVIAGVGVRGNPLYVRPSTSAAPGESTFFYEAMAARPDGRGGFDGTPYIYNVRWSHPDRVPADLVRRITDGELATVQTQIAAVAPDQWVAKDLAIDFRTPAVLTERFTPGITWTPWYLLLDAPLSRLSTNPLAASGAAAVTYRRGEHRVQRWFAGAFGPCFPDAFQPAIVRTSDTIHFGLNLYCDQAPTHIGFTGPEQESATLFRDGQPVGSATSRGSFDVPPGEATYRLEANVRQDFAAVSTVVTAVWTFRSGTVPGDEVRALPAAAVRFAPNLDEHNRAPAGRWFTMPVYLQQQGDAAVRDATIRVSYDDGRTWQPVRLHRAGPLWTVTLQHPPGDGFVSLKATAADDHGNTLDQTIIRAYALTP